MADPILDLLEDMEQRLGRFPRKIDRVVREEMEQAEKDAKANFLSYPGGDARSPKGKLWSRSGALQSLIQGSSFRQRDEIVGRLEVVPVTPFMQMVAEVQEFGGTMRSTRAGGLLAIPVGPMRDARGVQRFSGPKKIGPPQLRAAEQFYEFGFAKSKKRGTFLLWGKPRGSTGRKKTVMWILKQKVRVRGSRYLESAFRPAVKRIAKRLGALTF